MRRLTTALLVCAVAAMAQVTYYFSNDFVAVGWSAPDWSINGTPAAGSGGVRAWTISGPAKMSMISAVAVPGSSSNYEAKVTFRHSKAAIYLRATTNAEFFANAGTFYAVTYQSGTLAIQKRVSGTTTSLASTTASCEASDCVLRAIISGSNIHVHVNGVWKLSVSDSSVTSGMPGIGTSDDSTTTAYGIKLAEFAALETTAPAVGGSGSVSSSIFPTRVDMQWQGATDAGSGIWRYVINRNSTLLQYVTAPEFVDATASAATSYTYQIVAQDYHGNTTAMSSLSVTTPAAGTTDPRRVGVMSNGAHWGDMGEQIDMRSGNVNFTMPLVTARGREDTSVGFALSYNSQQWRLDAGGTWKLGRDTGYGFGWRLQVGSITPYWSDYYTIHHYLFINSTGAEYILDTYQDVGGNGAQGWTTKQGAHLWYDPTANRLYFPDGSFWVMGQLSGGGEQDAGSRYPTVVEDSNGNQVTIGYEADSARVTGINDVRGASYSFTYSTVNGFNHLTGISNLINTNESYTLNYSSGQTLYSPFTSPVNYGSIALLTSVVQNGIGLTQSFEYDNNGPGELRKTIFPYKGELRWDYRSFTYTSSRTLREAQYRYLVQSTGATPLQYTLTRDDSGDASLTTHAWTKLADAGGVGGKRWTFNTTSSSPYFGLATKYEGIALPSTTIAQDDFTWAQDSVNRVYLGTTLSTLDPGQTYAKQSKVEQTVDAFGNVTQKKIYDYGNLTTAARTFNTSFLGTTAYKQANILNRPTSSTVTDGTNTITLSSIDYDISTMLMTATPTSMHDSAYSSTSYLTRGNPSRVSGYGKRMVEYKHDATGFLREVHPGGVGVEMYPTVYAPAYNNTLMGSVTMGSLSTSKTFTSLMGLDVATGLNGATTDVDYDTYGRPSSVKLATGAYAYYTYAPTATPPSTTVTINGKWTKTSFDGFGRTVKVEKGYSTTTVSTVDTVYEACACSPLAKFKKSSRPYAPSGTVYWTTNAYDALGRTISVTLPNSAGTSTTSYQGNAVTVTDPAGKWKKTISNAMGQTTQLVEPNPAGGADLVTTYTYNVAGQLTQTQQVRGSVTQNRTTTYNSLGQISATASPEKGTTNFYYNSDYTLNYKIDAKNQKIALVYDDYKRVSQSKRYAVSSGSEDVCQRQTYYYDTHPYNPTQFTYTAGKLTAIEWGFNTSSCDAVTGGSWTESYGYTQAGQMEKKYLNYASTSTGSTTIGTDNTYNNEGVLTGFTNPGNTSAAGYSYTFDSMGRPLTLVNGVSTTVASGATYNAAGQLTQLTYGPSLGWTETNTFNALGQLTERSIPSTVDWTYTFSTTANNGQIEKQKDVITGEEVNYTYDALKRLATAETTSTDWGLSFGYDGFGNKLSQTVTKGTAPSMSITVNGNNQVTGQTYDANGNMTSGAGNTLTYDIDNRIATASGTSSEWYAYSPDNKRIWKKRQTGVSTYTYDIYFYGIGTGQLATFRYNSGSGWGAREYNIRFVGKLIKQGADHVVTDRLGSVKYRKPAGTAVRHDYWPYGEEKPSASAQDRDKFATYYRDDTGLDYADQRYFTNTSGRFVTPDPAEDGDNLYAYAGNDPVNRLDPSGLVYIFTSKAEAFWYCYPPGGDTDRACYQEGVSIDGGITVHYTWESLESWQPEPEFPEFIDLEDYFDFLEVPEIDLFQPIVSNFDECVKDGLARAERDYRIAYNDAINDYKIASAGLKVGTLIAVGAAALARNAAAAKTATAGYATAMATLKSRVYNKILGEQLKQTIKNADVVSDCNSRYPDPKFPPPSRPAVAPWE